MEVLKLSPMEEERKQARAKLRSLSMEYQKMHDPNDHSWRGTANWFVDAVGGVVWYLSGGKVGREPVVDRMCTAMERVTELDESIANSRMFAEKVASWVLLGTLGNEDRRRD